MQHHTCLQSNHHTTDPKGHFVTLGVTYGHNQIVIIKYSKQRRASH